MVEEFVYWADARYDSADVLGTEVLYSDASHHAVS